MNKTFIKQIIIKNIKINNNKINMDDNEVLKNNLDINLKCKYHSDSIMSSTALNDGRFATCSSDKSIIIYNNKPFKPD